MTTAIDTTLGIYWDPQGLYAAVTDEGQKLHLLLSPLDLRQEEKDLGPEGLIEKAVEVFKNTLQKNQIISTEAALAIPTKEIIFRAFIIPQMPQAEVKGTVDFEITKYIPFGLEEIAYAFHTVPIEEKGIRRLKVIFIGIRKNHLERFLKTFKKLDMDAVVIEPATVSLVRLLTKKNILEEEGSIVVVEKDADSGRIIVVKDGVPHFTREFQLVTVDTQADPRESLSPKQKLMNEIQISLDYFNRQDPGTRLDKLILLAEKINAPLMTELQEFLGLPVSGFEAHALMETVAPVNISYLSALGASIALEEPLPYSFSLVDGKRTVRKRKKKKNEPSFFSMPISGIRNVVQTLVVCTLILGGIYFMTHKKVETLEKEIVQLKINLGDFADTPTDTIETQNAKYSAQLASFKSEKISSDLSPVITALPDLMPEGVWFHTLKLQYLNDESKNKKKKPSKNTPLMHFTISGYTYRADPNAQFQSVSQFLTNLRNSDVIKKYFKDINLKTTAAQKVKDYDVTYFEIECK